MDQRFLPLDAVNVITMMLPKMENAINAAMTRLAIWVPKTRMKNKVAMSISCRSPKSSGTTQSFLNVSLFFVRALGLLHMQR